MNIVQWWRKLNQEADEMYHISQIVKGVYEKSGTASEMGLGSGQPRPSTDGEPLFRLRTGCRLSEIPQTASRVS